LKKAAKAETVADELATTTRTIGYKKMVLLHKIY